MSGCRKSNRLWGCVWDSEIDETEIEGGKSEKMIVSLTSFTRNVAHSILQICSLTDKLRLPS